MGADLHSEHTARLRAYESACESVARSAAAVIALETAARQCGKGINSCVNFGALNLPRVTGASDTVTTLSGAIAAATTAAHAIVNL